MLTGISLIPPCKAISAMHEHVTVHWRGVLSFDTWPISSLFLSRNKFMDLPLSNVTLLCTPIHSIYSLEVRSLHTYSKCSLTDFICCFLSCCTQFCSGLYRVYTKLNGRGDACVVNLSFQLLLFPPAYHIHAVLMQLWSSHAGKNSLMLCQGIITKESQQPGCDPTQHFHLLQNILSPWGYKYVSGTLMG